MSTPKISILIPTFNVEPFLAENLDAILAQDFTDFEVLLSDNCSTDDTFALIQRYAARDPRIRYWQNPTNLGIVANINRCLQEARGEFVKLVPGDDKLLHPKALRCLVEMLEQNPNVSLVSCASYIIDEQSHPLAVRNYFGRSGVWEGWKIINLSFTMAGNIIGEPPMFRRARCTHSFDPRYHQIGDLEFCFHLLEQGDFAFIAEPLAAWRQRAGQETEINRRSASSRPEGLWLIQDWYAKPWFRERATPELLFTQIYHIRKHYKEPGQPLAAEMMAALGRTRYAFYWFKRKITRPLKKLKMKLTNASLRAKHRA